MSANAVRISPLILHPPFHPCDSGIHTEDCGKCNRGPLPAWELLTPLCPSIRSFIEDETVSEIQVNASGEVFVETNGRVKREPVTMPEAERRTFTKEIARYSDREIDQRAPALDARLPDGSRVTATCPPVTEAWTLVIRKFNGHRFTLEELRRGGSVTDAQVELLTELVQGQKTILIAGATNTGKTTFLKALASLIPADERIAVIEESREIFLWHRNIIQFEARPAQGELEAVSVRDLVRLSLRYSPNRLILGEVRGPEAADLLAALSTGHGGSLTTVHAGSARAALTRLARLVIQAGMELPLSAIEADISQAIDAVVFLKKDSRTGKRYVAEILNALTSATPG